MRNPLKSLWALQLPLVESRELIPGGGGGGVSRPSDSTITGHSSSSTELSSSLERLLRVLSLQL